MARQILATRESIAIKLVRSITCIAPAIDGVLVGGPDELDDCFDKLVEANHNLKEAIELFQVKL